MSHGDKHACSQTVSCLGTQTFVLSAVTIEFAVFLFPFNVSLSVDSESVNRYCTNRRYMGLMKKYFKRLLETLHCQIYHLP